MKHNPRAQKINLSPLLLQGLGMWACTLQLYLQDKIHPLSAPALGSKTQHSLVAITGYIQNSGKGWG